MVVMSLLLLIDCTNGYAQVQDSVIFEIDDLHKDSLSATHLGFGAGFLMQTLWVNANPSFGDSIQFSTSSPQTGYCLGLVWNGDLSDKMWIKSGLILSISKFNINYDYRLKPHSYYFNYSTLSIPFWIERATQSKRKGFNYGAGFHSVLDISKIEDFDNRIFKMQRLSMDLGIGMGYRWELSTGKRVNLALNYHFGLLNLLDQKQDSFYNQSLKSIFNNQLQLFLSVN